MTLRALTIVLWLATVPPTVPMAARIILAALVLAPANNVEVPTANVVVVCAATKPSVAGFV